MSKLESKNQKENKISWLEKIQSLDHHTKTNLLIILSILAIGFIVFIWGAYFNFMLAKLSEDETIQAQNNQGGFLNKIKGGSAFIFDSGFSFFKYLGNIFDKPREYIIQ